ncbi:MAG: acyloxyacyl hydrolase [Actinomycetota bacterium]
MAQLEARAISHVWREGVGSGFRRGARQLGFAVGGGPGLRTLGSREHHDLVMGSLHYGQTLGRNWAWQGELFGGAQVRSEDELLLGGTYLMRYHLPTRSRWLTFANLGAGVTYTSVREPDLSTGFEFNLVGGFGTHYFYTKDTAVTVEARWFHLSNAGLDSPNRGRTPSRCSWA